MTFEQLLYVEVLSHHKSLQKAADVLHITKPGLSLAISELEEELGMKIFERTNRGTKVTPDGIRLLSTISDILRSKADLERLVSYAGEVKKKEVVRIRYINTMFTAFMKPFIEQYSDWYEDVFYDISRDDTQSIINLVRNGEIDAGFIASSDIESEWMKDLIFQPVCYGKIVLGVSATSPLRDHPVTLEELKRQKYCLYDDLYHETLFDRLQYLCGPLDLILKTDDHWAITEAVTKLDAVSLGRDLQGRFSREENTGDIAMLEVGHLFNDKISLGWVLNPRVQHSDAAEDLIEQITEEIKKEAATL